MWDLSSPTRDRTHAPPTPRPLQWKRRVLTTGPPGNSPVFHPWISSLEQGQSTRRLVSPSPGPALALLTVQDGEKLSKQERKQERQEERALTRPAGLVYTPWMPSSKARLHLHLHAPGLVTLQPSPLARVHRSSPWDLAVPWGLPPPHCPQPSAIRLRVGTCRRLPSPVADIGDSGLNPDLALPCVGPSYLDVTRATQIKPWPGE